MKHILLFLTAIFSFSHLFAALQEVYVSSSSGNDANNGSQNSPLKTIAAAPRQNIKLLLKRGDTFFEELRNFSNCEIDAYGEGAKPLICGLKIVKNPDAWLRMPSDIWEIDLRKDENFEGMLTNSHPDKFNIGAVYNIANDKVYGHLVKQVTDLQDYGDFFAAKDSSCNADHTRLRGHNFAKLYFKSKGNPSANGAKIAFSTACHGVSLLKDCKISNIAIKGFGKHGICTTHNCEIQNIDIDLIGGSIQCGYKSKWVRFGNGIEFWITSENPCNNNIVKGCKVSRTYDCGSTIQGIAKQSSKAIGNKFIGNTFINCRQAFEHFLRSKNGTAVYEDCEFSGNKCYNIGDNQFNTPELRDANLLSYDSTPNTLVGLKIDGNTFFGGNVYCANKFPVAITNNTFYVLKGQYLYYGKGDPKSVIWADSDADINSFSDAISSSSNKIIILDSPSLENLIRTSLSNSK